MREGTPGATRRRLAPRLREGRPPTASMRLDIADSRLTASGLLRENGRRSSAQVCGAPPTTVLCVQSRGGLPPQDSLSLFSKVAIGGLSGPAEVQRAFTVFISFSGALFAGKMSADGVVKRRSFLRVREGLTGGACKSLHCQ